MTSHADKLTPEVRRVLLVGELNAVNRTIEQLKDERNRITLNLAQVKAQISTGHSGL